MAAPDAPKIPETPVFDQIALVLLSVLAMFIGAALAYVLASAGRPFAAAIAGILPLALFLGNWALVRATVRAASFKGRGWVAAAAVLLGGLAATVFSVWWLADCTLGGLATCLSLDGIPWGLFTAITGLIETIAGFRILYEWADAAGKKRLQGALDGVGVTIDLMGTVVASGEIAILLFVGPIVLIAVLISWLYHIPLWAVGLSILIAIVGFGALVGAIVGPSMDEKVKPEPAPPVMAPVPVLQVPMMVASPRMAPPPPPSPPPVAPPVGTIAGAYGHHFAVQFCPACGSDAIAIAAPPARLVRCTKCGRESPY